MHCKALAGGWRTRGARDGGGFSCFSRHFLAPSSPGISPYDREGAPHSLASREFTVAKATRQRGCSLSRLQENTFPSQVP